jgi:hypothetical protein
MKMTGKGLCNMYDLKLITIIETYNKLFGIELKKNEAYFRNFNEVEVKLILENILQGVK